MKKEIFMFYSWTKITSIKKNRWARNEQKKTKCHYTFIIFTELINSQKQNLMDWCNLTKGYWMSINQDGVFCVLFFGLLSSSLLLLVATQRFDRCILRHFSVVSYLSGYGNDSAREIVLKVSLLISEVESFPYPDKQGTTEEGRRIQRPKRCD